MLKLTFVLLSCYVALAISKSAFEVFLADRMDELNDYCALGDGAISMVFAVLFAGCIAGEGRFFLESDPVTLAAEFTLASGQHGDGYGVAEWVGSGSEEEGDGPVRLSVSDNAVRAVEGRMLSPYEERDGD